MLVSICIPTKDRATLLDQTLLSIYNEAVDNSLYEYEVVISDNSDGDETLKVVEKYRALGMACVYYKNPEKGFYNSIKALTLGRGTFLKLHNDYTKFKSGCLGQLIDLVSDNLINKPQMIFTDRNLKSGQLKRYNDFDTFLSGSSYWNTWSSAFSIWKEDLDKLPHAANDLNDQFPHTSLLFENCSKREYLIDDRLMFENSTVPNKGGYNIFYNFCVLYIEMLKSIKADGVISQVTFQKIRFELGFRFVSLWYANTILKAGDFSFDKANYNKHIRHSYSFIECVFIKLVAAARVLRGYFWSGLKI